MGVSSVVLAGIEVIDTTDYYLSQDSLPPLMSILVPVEPRLAEMAGRHPILTGWTPKERSFTLTVGFHGNTIQDRETNYLLLLAALGPRYVQLSWTVNATTRTLNVLCSDAVVEPWYKTAAVALLAADPAPF